MLAFLKLIRIQNLLIIAFTQYMVRWCLLHPILQSAGLELRMSELNFFLLSLSTVMLAAAGYIINDYFDVKIDKVNKPERLVIGKGVKRRVAIGAHTVINFLAIIIGLYVSYRSGSWKLVVIHFITATGLWFYSTNFKRQFLIGNIVIAFFTAMVPLTVGIYELYGSAGTIPDVYISGAWKWILAISFFAFITTLLREIIKDIEDHDGDKAYGCKTMPIVIGIRASKNVVICLALATIAALAMIQYHFYGDSPAPFVYLIIPMQLSLLFLIWKINAATTKKDFRLSGNTAKAIMLMGVCYLFLLVVYIF
jgi:4-hydroxybenzoate polyprenyltransferase